MATTEAPRQKTEPAPVAEPHPQIIPYVTTTLRTLWLSTAWPTLGYVYSTAGDKNGPPVAYYRVTPNVYTWLRRQLAVADDRAAAGDSDVLKDQVRVIGGRWRPVADWAELAYTAAERAAAVALLPALAVKAGAIPGAD
jgi:hypothetical protein